MKSLANLDPIGKNQEDKYLSLSLFLVPPTGQTQSKVRKEGTSNDGSQSVGFLGCRTGPNIKEEVWKGKQRIRIELFHLLKFLFYSIYAFLGFHTCVHKEEKQNKELLALTHKITSSRNGASLTITVNTVQFWFSKAYSSSNTFTYHNHFESFNTCLLMVSLYIMRYANQNIIESLNCIVSLRVVNVQLVTAQVEQSEE